SRLSYFLWSSMPDDELFQRAEEQRLHDPAVLNAQVQRMLRDPKSAARVEKFGEQWLNLRLMDRTKPDSGRFLSVDDELLDAMRQETLLFVGAVVHENRSILDFIDGRFTFVNGPLARYYGIKGVDGEAFQRVELDGVQRSGIVTQGSVLTIASYSTRTSPVLRGNWVLDNLLGSGPPPPPAGSKSCCGRSQTHSPGISPKSCSRMRSGGGSNEAIVRSSSRSAASWRAMTTGSQAW